MAENLKVIHYRNGDTITNVTDISTWENLTTGACCNHNNNEDYVKNYGRHYNWYTVNDSRNIALTGWHVPTDTEWQTLIDYLGGEEVAGGKMKTTGTTLTNESNARSVKWWTPNTGATNESGFSALPGSKRSPK